ncbi:MAG TPA: helix-turn-helix transcriptional regulator [Pyrinomonadaceae bacterium]|nr:helix-turn-helix transcriptional regulator [Chloracidobacterium sp.]MBL0241558.1 helix-turn-helix transcriptional regulator [Chloracidobacterium sp.]MBP9935798.1 helix-turn-helix transcriptional regulator [Pyrinomonadaceae bacterium]HQX55732.1 helix-turn-helix transcriptional regulator [Pyrinomonadaceae bacterium]HRA40717.1 helix-turn-helix transcriptional regulator [Pyrinomonadaceae bacterium]
MEKSIYSHDYSIFLDQLRRLRASKSLTQVQIAERLNQTQSFVSKVERGERRLDVVELRAFCRALGIDFAAFLTELESRLEGSTNGGGKI